MFDSSTDFVLVGASRPCSRPGSPGRTFITAALGMSLFVPSWLAVAGSSAPGSKLGYNRDVRPLLSDNCFACHGPDKNQRKGELRLDVREAALEKEAIVPGKPA